VYSGVRARVCMCAVEMLRALDSGKQRAAQCQRALLWLRSCSRIPLILFVVGVGAP
jgi:hypothetical protein